MIEKFLERKLAKLGYIKQDEILEKTNELIYRSTTELRQSLNDDLIGLNEALRALHEEFNQLIENSKSSRIFELAEDLKGLDKRLTRAETDLSQAIVDLNKQNDLLTKHQENLNRNNKDIRDLTTDMNAAHHAINVINRVMITHEDVAKRLQEIEKVSFSANKRAEACKKYSDEQREKAEETLNTCLERVNAFEGAYKALLNLQKNAGKMNSQEWD